MNTEEEEEWARSKGQRKVGRKEQEEKRETGCKMNKLNLKRNWPFPPIPRGGPKDQTQVFRLACRCLYRSLTKPSRKHCFFFSLFLTFEVVSLHVALAVLDFVEVLLTLLQSLVFIGMVGASPALYQTSAVLVYENC